MTSNKKVILFIDSLVSGGAQRQILILATELAKTGYAVSLLTYHDINELECTGGLGIKLYCVPKDANSFLTFMWKIYKYFNSVKPVAIIAYLHTPSLLARLLGRLAGVKKIITSERNHDLEKSKKIYLLERLTYRLSTNIVTNSFCVRDRLEQLLPRIERRIEVIYNAVDLNAFSPVSQEMRENTRREFDIGLDQFVFLLPGRLIEQKNHTAMIRAVSMIAGEYSFQVVFVGNELDCKLKQKLLKEIEFYNLESRVQFVGFQQDMRQMYGLADVVVLPSLWEGLPNVVIEAMACNRPIIASNISDNKLIIKRGCGYVVDIDEVSNLSNAMASMLNASGDELLVMGNSCRELIAQQCSLSVFREKYISLIEH